MCIAPPPHAYTLHALPSWMQADLSGGGQSCQASGLHWKQGESDRPCIGASLANEMVTACPSVHGDFLWVGLHSIQELSFSFGPRKLDFSSA